MIVSHCVFQSMLSLGSNMTDCIPFCVSGYDVTYVSFMSDCKPWCNLSHAASWSLVSYSKSLCVLGHAVSRFLHEFRFYQWTEQW